MLEVSEITRNYGKFVAVDNVSFTIGRGEIVGLLGHNGAGKTTIMKMLSGYLEPDYGRVTISGRDISDETKTVQRELGYLPENLPVYPELTVADYLDYSAELKGLSGVQKNQQIKYVIKATDIGDRLLSPIANLSRGLKQRVGVAQAILGQPKLLILDEPTNGLDPTQTDHMRELIRSIANNATVILSTHIMQEVDALCDRVLIVRAGQLAVDARLDQLRANNKLLIHCSMDTKTATQQLSLPGTDGLEVVDDQSSVKIYRLGLQDNVDVNLLSASLAKTIVSQGMDLYQLKVERQDLETVFRKVNEIGAVSMATTGGVKNAA